MTLRTVRIPAAAWLAVAITLTTAANSRGGVFLKEDFEGLELRPAVNENIQGLGWTDTPPPGWTVDDSGVPGALSGDDMRDGRTEWAGWAFADKEWWVTADDQRRSEFDLGTGIVAVADPDEWDDQAHDPFGPGSLYNAYMSTPNFSVNGYRPGKLFLSFASSWRDECCDDTPTPNDQQAVIYARWDGGPEQRILRWSSVSTDPDFHNDAPNEFVKFNITPPQGAENLQLRFGLIDAENDWWWAIDNLVVADALPEFKVVVDTADGDVGIVNDSEEAIDLKGYTLTSASGSLDPAAWASFEDSGDAGAGWLESFNASANNLTETNFDGSFLLNPGDRIYLGKAFELGGDENIAFSFLPALGAQRTGFVEYDDFEPPVIEDVLGDTDGDKDVDLDDLNNVRNFFGTPSTDGDADHDGDTDLDDLNAVRNFFGTNPGAPGTVPEPGSLALLGLGIVIAGIASRRFRS